MLFNMDVTNDEHPKEVLGGLNALRARSELTDVVLEVEGRSFPCHRAVLAACSPYFNTMFTSGYAEKNKGSIRIQDVSHVAMATILDYAYTGCLKTEPDQVQAVMSAARLLQVDFVSQKAAEYMKDLLDVSNCSDVLMYADMLGDLTLQEACGRYMASRFHQVALQLSFLQLSLPQLQSVLNRDDLVPSSEDDVVQAALRWIDFDQEERMSHLPVLFKSFRHSFISAQCRVQLESKCLSTDCKLVYNNSETQRLGQMRVETLIFLNESQGITPATVESTRSAPCYIPSSGMLYSMNLPRNRYTFSMVVTPDDELYLAGGVFGVTMRDCLTPKGENSFFQYNHLLNTWESRCDMMSPRISCALVYLKGYIYAIGGVHGNQTAERYDPSCDEWTSIATLPSNIFFKRCTVSLDDSIYVISKEGCNCFSPTENTWNKIADIPNPPQGWGRAVVYQGCIFCVDRQHMSPSKVICMYNPKQGVWKVSFSLSILYMNAILIPFQGYLYVVCNLTAFRQYKNIVYRYEPQGEDWLEVTGTCRIVPPMREWFGPGYMIECLVARMIPPCLGYGRAHKNTGEGSDDREEIDDSFSDFSGSGVSDDSDNEHDPLDQDDSSDDVVEEERESESDDEDV